MKLRRALAAAAATAVIAPAALMAAPAAYADENPSDLATVETQPTDEDNDKGSGDGGKTGDKEGGKDGSKDGGKKDGDKPGDTTPGDDDEKPGDTTPGDEDEKPGDTTPGDEDEKPGDTTPGDEDEKPGDTTPGDEDEKPGDTPGDEDEDEGEFPECEPAKFKSSLSGFPNKIVAGSGWKEFYLNLDNTKGDDLEEVVIGAAVLYKEDLESDFERDLFSKYAKFQYFDGERWSSDLSDGGSIGGWLSVEAGEKISLKLRLSISAAAPAGSAVAIAFGVYGDEDSCYFDEKWYDFEVLAAGQKSGQTGDAKPTAPKKPVNVKPQGDVKEFEGELAKTGSSSALPMFALAGGMAVALGAGAVYIVRRRQGAGADTSAVA